MIDDQHTVTQNNTNDEHDETNQEYTNALANMSKTLEHFKTVLPTVTIKTSIVGKMDSVIKPYSDYINSPAFLALTRQLQNNASTYALLANKAKEIINQSTVNYNELLSPIYKLIATLQKDYLAKVVDRLQFIDFESPLNRIYETVFYEAVQAKWVPSLEWIIDMSFVDTFLEVIETTKGVRSRTKAIDRLMFSYYTKSRIETIKKSWRDQLPYYKYRMLHQAVQAYHRAEYALTLSMMSTMWEGIINDKVGATGHKTGSRTKTSFIILIDELEYKDYFFDFFEQFVFYHCNSEDDVIDDVPGRHSVAHSYYKSYPSKKAALNAILFTDFLLKIDYEKGNAIESVHSKMDV